MSTFSAATNVAMKRLMGLLAALLGASSSSAQDTVPDQLSQLSDLLKRKRPEVIASLRPPLSVEHIAGLEHEYQIALPDAVKSLYSWHDGQDPSGFTVFVNNMTFQPLSEVLQTKAELDGMIGYDFDLENWWHPAWLPLFHNGAGDFIVVDLAGVHTGNRNQVLKVYHDWQYRPIVAESLGTFLDATLKYHRAKSTDEMDESHVIDDFLPGLEQSFDASGRVEPLE